MDEERNPLQKLPKTTRFQIMVSLAYMWCAIFCLGVGSYVLFGVSLALHTLLLVGIFTTTYIFERANKQQIISPRNSYKDKKDGGVMYDDIWGGS
jgi:hypothetical protein